MKISPRVSHARPALKQQTGFTLVELLVVAAIIAILTIAALPQIQAYIVSGKVGPANNEMQRGLTRMKINAEGNGTTPYSGVTTAVFANTMRDGSVFTVAGVAAAATIKHGLTASGAGVVAVAPAKIVTTGDAFSITMNGVNRGACPDIAATMQKSAAQIAINGTTVKPIGGKFDGAAATNACIDTNTDSNVFIFTVQ
ncbi:hypothetical protein BH10PSE16_BH10PSE16_04010 [soil metagenome]